MGERRGGRLTQGLGHPLREDELGDRSLTHPPLVLVETVDQFVRGLGLGRDEGGLTLVQVERLSRATLLPGLLPHGGANAEGEQRTHVRRDQVAELEGALEDQRLGPISVEDGSSSTMVTRERLLAANL